MWFELGRFGLIWCVVVGFGLCRGVLCCGVLCCVLSYCVAVVCDGWYCGGV